MDERDLSDLTMCRRCGAAVASMTRHRQWHDALEGTHDPLPSPPTSPGGNVGRVR